MRASEGQPLSSTDHCRAETLPRSLDVCVCLAGGGYKKSYKSSYFCFFKLDFLILKDWKLSTNPEGLQDKNLSLVYDLWSARQCKKCDLLIINIPGLISPIVP